MLNQDQTEALQEIANIGMGQAGASIARVMNEFVHLSIPRVLVLARDQVPAALAQTVGAGDVSAVRQAFHCDLRGEAVVIYRDQRCNDLADIMGYEEGLDHAGEIEILLDVTNLLVGACLGGIAEQLKSCIGFSAPSLMADHVAVQDIFGEHELPWQTALLVEVNFRFDARSFACHMIMLMPEEEIRATAQALDRFLEAY